MTPGPEVVGGFRRILARLDAPTRREYCASALEEDLEAARGRLQACAAALAQARQVEDATRQIEASVPGGGATRVASPSVQTLLAELEALQQRAAGCLSALNGIAEAARRQRKTSVGEDDQEDDGKRRRADARAVVHELDALLADAPVSAKAAKQAARLVRRFLALLPEREDAKHAGFWRERLKERVVLPAVQRAWLAKDAALAQGREIVARLAGQLETAARTRPHLAPVCRELGEEVAALLAKRERKEARRKDREEAPSNKSKSKSKKRRLQEVERAATPEPTTGPRLAIHEVRATLARCAREIKQASEREFELAAFDANLKRLVDVVGALSSEFAYDDCTSLTVALFTMVEHVEKLADAARRRDRLVCLEGLLKVLIDCSDVPLSSRRRTMAKEYLQNCQQSIRLLDRAGGDAAADSEPSPSPSTSVAAQDDTDDVPITKLKKSKKQKKKKDAVEGGIHMHFD